MMARLLAVMITAVLLLGGCSFSPTVLSKNTPPEEGKSTGKTPDSKSSPTSSPTSSQTNDGKYYLDDGPPTAAEQQTAAQAQDAVVRWEPLMSSRNRPYVALGKRYTPYRRLLPYRREGVASWYGRRYHGRPTASGEKYDMFIMTAAHPLLPIPSYVRVTRPANGTSVVVRVNDRGPFLGGRLIDLSFAAAQRLGMVKAGTAEVIVELLISPNTPASAIDVNAAAEAIPVAVSGGVYIQLAAFSEEAAAEEFLTEIRLDIPAKFGERAEIYAEGEFFRVQVGPYPTHEAAAEEDKVLCGTYEKCGFLTQR